MRAYVELVRAPAALTVLGDTVAGASASGVPLRGKRLLLPLSSVAFYWAGMALNDWADRELDAVERPERPIPSGRVSPEAALGTAVGLTAAGLGLAALGGGKAAVKVAVPLAAAVWAYDTLLKPTIAGPLGMALCRALDVLMGGNAPVAAAAVGVHTLGVTALSTGEVHGASATTARAAMATSCVATTLAVSGQARGRLHRAASLAAGSGYAGLVGRAQADAARDPSARKVRKATMTGIHGMVPLQAAVAARGSLLGAALVSAALPLARALSRKVSPT